MANRSKQLPVVNLKLAYEALHDCVKQLCQCGHFDSEHFMNKRYKPTNCNGCACPKFKQAYKMTRTSEKPHGKKR